MEEEPKVFSKILKLIRTLEAGSDSDGSVRAAASQKDGWTSSQIHYLSAGARTHYEWHSVALFLEGHMEAIHLSVMRSTSLLFAWPVFLTHALYLFAGLVRDVSRGR